MLISDPSYFFNKGIAYVVYGQSAYSPTSDDADSLFEVQILLSEIQAGNSSYGFAVYGASGSLFGHSASNAG
jgi:hypothetical protein